MESKFKVGDVVRNLNPLYDRYIDGVTLVGDVWGTGVVCEESQGHDVAVLIHHERPSIKRIDTLEIESNGVEQLRTYFRVLATFAEGSSMDKEIMRVIEERANAILDELAQD